MNDEKSSAEKVAKRPWVRRLFLGIVVGAVLLILAGPWLLAKTPLRNVLLAALVNSEAVSIDSRDASFGYFSSLSLSGLHVQTADQTATVNIAEIKADKSWLGMLMSRPELGRFSFDQPRIEVITSGKLPQLPEQEPEDLPNETDRAPLKLPSLSAEITDAAVLVRTPDRTQPAIDLQHINVSFHINPVGEGSVLVVDPIVVFDHQAITPELCGQGLQLVAPLLADEVSAEGEFSFRLDTFRVPVGTGADAERAQQVEIEGVVELHSASVGLKNTVTSKVLQLAVKLLGEELPAQLTVAEDVAVQFSVQQGRVHHEGLAFVLPHKEKSIEIQSQGSVGLDESLDLQVSVKLPAGLLGDSALASRLTEQPIVVHVGGTLESPELGLPDDATWANRLTRLLQDSGEGGGDSELASKVTELVGGLLERAADRPPREPRSEPLFPRLRGRRQERRDRRDP